MRRSFSAGEVLINEGTLGRHLFVIEEGELTVLGRACLADQSSVEIPVARLLPGSVFGESSLIGDYSSVATVRADSSGRLIQIKGQVLSVYLDDNPQLGYLFFKYLFEMELDNLARTNRGVVDLSMLGNPARVPQA